MQLITLLCRLAFGLVAAVVYQVATNPFILAALLLLNGHGDAALWLLAIWGFVHALAVLLSDWTVSPLTGQPICDAPRWLWFFGNAQDGYLSRRHLHPGWPWWLVAFAECAWRNKLRNLPFVKGLSWLHRPAGRLQSMSRTVGAVTLRVRWRGWMTEIEYFTAERFGDFGPRLDQPDEWGGVSWAFRPWGRI